MIRAGENIITESEYQILVELCSDRNNKINGSYISKILVEDYFLVENRSFLGRFLFRIAKDYANAACILATVVGYPMNNEDNVWCRFDYAMSRFYLYGDVIATLQQLYLVRQWLINNPDQLLFLSVDEITQAINKVKQNNKLNNN